MLHSRLHRYAAISFVEGGELVLGPAAGVPGEPVRSFEVSFEGAKVAELAVASVAGNGEEQAFLERVALLISPYCLVGWDTGGVPWSEVS